MAFRVLNLGRQIRQAAARRTPPPDTKGPKPMSEAERVDRIYRGTMPAGQNSGYQAGLDGKGKLL